MARLPPKPPPPDREQLAQLLLERRLANVRPEIHGQYLSWDEVRRLSPPEGLDHASWWYVIQMRREGLLRDAPLRDKSGESFRFGIPDSVARLLHTIDRDASGTIQTADDVINRSNRDQYVISGLIEEAITSSQLEGASTTRRVAKQMLESSRPPRTHDERMIWNNFRAMEWVRENVSRPFSTNALLELHRLVTIDALDGGSDGAGRFRRPDENIVVVDASDGEVAHVPPPAETLDERVSAMCEFGNDSSADVFVHPVVRAILLHFWLAHDHPFVDGNGRTARALFYWSMLKQGYWLTEFLSISRIIKKAPAQYSRAFAEAESEGNDATYFISHQTRVIRQAIDELLAYLRRKAREAREVETRLADRAELSPRQLAILSRLARHPDESWTVQKHQRTSGVVYETARRDLLDLAERGYLVQRKKGRAFEFVAAKDLTRRLKR